MDIVRGISTPRYAALSGLPAGRTRRINSNLPLEEWELPGGAFFFHPRQIVKWLNDFVDSKLPAEGVANYIDNLPEWVRTKHSKLGQDSYRLAAFIYSRLKYRFPGSRETFVPMDASVILRNRFKYENTPIELLAEWSVRPPNKDDFNDPDDVASIAMAPILWARKVASKRLGTDIPFYYKSTGEEIADYLIDRNAALYAALFTMICNYAAGKALPDLPADQVRAAKEVSDRVGKQVGESIEDEKDRTSEQALTLGASSGAYAAMLIILGNPASLAVVLAAVPLLCFAGKEAALELLERNFRKWLPDLVPGFILQVYRDAFGKVPKPDIIKELTAVTSGANNANTIAQIVTQTQYSPEMIDATLRRQKAIREKIKAFYKQYGCQSAIQQIDTLGKKGGFSITINPVALLAAKAFDYGLTDAEIEEEVKKTIGTVCSKDFVDQIKKARSAAVVKFDRAKLQDQIMKAQTPLITQIENMRRKAFLKTLALVAIVGGAAYYLYKRRRA